MAVYDEPQLTTIEKFGVLLVNAGAPSAPTTPAVRAFQRQRLSVSRRFPETGKHGVTNGLLPLWLRLSPAAARTAKHYRAIWTEQGSPLLVNTGAQAAALQTQLDSLGFAHCAVKVAMTSGDPAIGPVIESFTTDDIRRILVIPLYPQLSVTTTGVVYAEVLAAIQAEADLPALRFVNEYHLHEVYIDALAQSVTDYWREHGKPQRLLMSFRGIPGQGAVLGNPYSAQCKATARAVATRLKLGESQWLCCFHSRGRGEWSKPVSRRILKEWGEEGCGRVDILCPGVTADCYETLVDIKRIHGALFRRAGGENLHYIAALNHRPEFINCLFDLVNLNAQGW